MKKLLLMLLAACAISGCATGKTEYVHVGPNWNQINSLPEGGDVKVDLSAEKNSYQVGEKMSFTVTSDKSGKLWLVSVGPDDKVSLLFPNELSPANDITAYAALTIPSGNADWDLKAAEPLGRNVILALVTTGNIERNQIVAILRGQTTEKSIEKAIIIEQKAPQWGSAKTVVNVVGGE